MFIEITVNQVINTNYIVSVGLEFLNIDYFEESRVVITLSNNEKIIKKYSNRANKNSSSECIEFYRLLVNYLKAEKLVELECYAEGFNSMKRELNE